MALDDAEKERRRAILQDSLVPAKYVGRPLSKAGSAGEQLRSFMKSEWPTDSADLLGAIVVSEVPMLAASFARDIVIAGDSAQFYYMQTFASRILGLESLPQAFVIEWFEQKGADTPFTSRERFLLETEITRLIEDGTRFYLFTSVDPDVTKWWSRSFADYLAENSRIIRIGNDGNQHGNKRTPVRDTQGKGQKGSQGNSRIRVR